jgi:hypothetical protein
LTSTVGNSDIRISGGGFRGFSFSIFWANSKIKDTKTKFIRMSNNNRYLLKKEKEVFLETKENLFTE